jgi:hypothetical protein
MITTSTPELDLTVTTPQQKTEEFGLETPSVKVINSILNYSKNLEIKVSKLVTEIEVIKS